MQLKHVMLSKVIVSLPFETEDFMFVHENYELIQSTVLDQIRLIKRGDRIPIHLSIRKSPVWISIEEFGGYQSPNILGIISNETELVVVELNHNNIKSIKVEEKLPHLFAVPSLKPYFACHSFHNLPEICSYKNHSFKILKDDSVHKNCILIPYVIIYNIFKISSKEKIQFSRIHEDMNVPFSSFTHYTFDGMKPEINLLEHSNESIISSPNGISIKTNYSNSDEVIKLKSESNLDNLNTYTNLLLETSYRMILFNGQSGCGKTEIVLETINQLNFRPDYFSRIIYIDLLTSDFESHFDLNSSKTFILDHVDEYLQEGQDDEKINRKYVKLWKKLEWILLMNIENRITIISRTAKIFSKLSTKFSLPFDYVFKHEKSNNWNLQLNHNRFDSIRGLSYAISLLELHILHPLQFSNIYKFNQMNLHSR